MKIISNKNKPSVSHKSYSSIPFMPEGIGPTIHETKVSKGKRSSSGVGYSRTEADKKAGDNYRRGKRD